MSKVNAYNEWCLRIDVKKKELLKSNNSLLIERMPGYIGNSTSMIMNELYSMNRRFENQQELLKKIDKKVDDSYMMQGHVSTPEKKRNECVNVIGSLNIISP